MTSPPDPLPRPVDGRPAVEPSPVRSLDDRLAFRRAQGVLSGLTGCTQAAAAHSLRSTAAQLGRPVPDVAHLFLDALESRGDEWAVDVVLLLTAGALLPARGGPGPRDDLDGAQGAALAALRTAVAGALGGSAPPVIDPSALRSLDAAARVELTATVRGLAAGADPPAQPAGAALEALYDRWAGACLAVALSLLGDGGRAEHAVEAAFLDAWEHLAAGEPVPAPAERWLRRRTHRHAVSRLRADRDRLPAEPPSPAGRELLAALPGHQRRTLQWAAWGGCTVQDIAGLTGAPLADVCGDLLAGVRTLGRLRASGSGAPGSGQPG